MKAPIGSGLPGAEKSMLLSEEEKEERLIAANRRLWTAQGLSCDEVELTVLRAQGLPPVLSSRKR